MRCSEAKQKRNTEVRIEMKRVLTLLAAIAPLAVCGCSASSAEFQTQASRQVSAAGISSVSVVTRSPDVTVEGIDANTITVRAYLTGGWNGGVSSRSVTVVKRGSQLAVSWPAHGWCMGFCDMRLEVAVPRRLPLNVTTTSGDVSISGTNGAVSVQTSSGDVRLARASSDLRVRTSSGDVRADVAEGWRGRGIAVDTSSGDVFLRVPSDFRGHLVTSTDRGDVHNGTQMHGPVLVRVDTSSGDINVETR